MRGQEAGAIRGERLGRRNHQLAERPAVATEGRGQTVAALPRSPHQALREFFGPSGRPGSVACRAVPLDGWGTLD